ncbi:uncharacterized protein LOC106869802 isoform X3 [Octopus bimaculoides]|uniref:uncharacterized protein LOC106869802 isoform X2 n=1 Tax=Octopus bimaculoides TaxID=37653 RepID=UPI0022DF516B|nr:uncharacterized protein LOC106869802 isoform X2 [Octopus bimaculoides]XP_052824927.1 uncharacterized protein LOC106869802 isoform X3 [Octopus bimaculoides]
MMKAMQVNIIEVCSLLMLFVSFASFCLASGEVRKEGVHNITQSEIVELGQCVALHIEVPGLKRPFKWFSKCGKFECDTTCANGSDFRLTQNVNTCTLWIGNVTSECLKWYFEDSVLNTGCIKLQIYDKKTETSMTTPARVVTAGLVIAGVVTAGLVIA